MPYRGAKARLLWGIWVFSAPSAVALLSATAFPLCDQRYEMRLDGVSTFIAFGVLILASSALVTSTVATAYLALLLAPSNVPGAVKARGAAVVGLGWLLIWFAWQLLLRDCIVA